MMLFFPDSFLKNRLLHRGYRVLAPVWQAWLRRTMTNPGTRMERLGSNYGGWYVPVYLVRPDWIVYSGGASAWIPRSMKP